MRKRKIRGDWMEFIELTEKEFKKFADVHSQISFHQTNEWGRLKEFI